MDCIILTGGFGKRLKKFLPDIPKTLAPINGTPFLDVLLNQLNSFSLISNIILAIGYKAKEYIQYYKNSNLIFSVEQTPLGTGGAIKLALSKTNSENILILNGDSFINFSLSSFFAFHKKQKADCSIIYTHVQNISRYGSLVIDKNNHRLLSFNEKIKTTSSGNISAGVYLINKNLLNNIPLNPISLEKDIFPKLINKNRFYGYHSNENFIDIGTKESYLKAQKLLNTKRIL